MHRLLAILFVIGSSSFAQNGAVYTDFGSSGELLIDIDALDELEGLLTDPDGNIYFYGHSSSDLGGYYPFDIVIGKLDPDGNPDFSFGTDGLFRADFPGYAISSLTQAVWDTSGIYFIGRGTNTAALDSNGFFLGKITQDGVLDPGFGMGGFYTNQFMGTYNTPGSLIIDSDGKVVFCGSTTHDGATFLEYPLIGRLYQDGTPDSTFGATGIQIWNYFDGVLVDFMHLPMHGERHGEGGYFTELAQIGNDYVCAGHYQSSASTQMYVTRFSADGNFSDSFIYPAPLYYEIEPGINHYMEDIEIHNNKIFLAFKNDGFTYGEDFTIHALDSAGNLLEVHNISKAGYDLSVKNMIIYNDKPYFGGYALNKENSAPGHLSDDFLIYSTNSDFSPIATFGDSGAFSHHFPYDQEQGMEALIHNGQYLLLGGYVNNLSAYNYTDLAFVAVGVDPTNAVMEELSDEPSVYPNPVTENLFIANVENAIYDYLIYDQTGRVSLKATDNLYEEPLNISHLASGYYIIRGESKNHTFESAFSKQ